MERLKLYLISCIVLLYITIGNVCMPVHAAELELEPCESIVNNPYEFKISYTWTSEGETFQSYDISEGGQIAIVFSNSTIGVFDHDMNFQYQLSFNTSGSAGVLWLDEKLLFINLRSNTAVECDKNGSPEKYYDIAGPGNYYSENVTTRLRIRGNYKYFCTNNSGGDNPLVHYGFYTVLKRKSADGEEEILYKVDTLFDGVFGVRLVVFGYLSIYVISALGVVVWKLRGRFGKKSART